MGDCWAADHRPHGALRGASQSQTRPNSACHHCLGRTAPRCQLVRSPGDLIGRRRDSRRRRSLLPRATALMRRRPLGSAPARQVALDRAPRAALAPPCWPASTEGRPPRAAMASAGLERPSCRRKKKATRVREGRDMLSEGVICLRGEVHGDAKLCARQQAVFIGVHCLPDLVHLHLRQCSPLEEGRGL